MTLTPSTVRLDLKCGKGAISEGEKCHKGTATRSVKAKEKSAKAQKVLNTVAVAAGITGAALLGVAVINGIKAEQADRRFLRAQNRMREARIRNMERNQRNVAAANRANPSADFMRGFGVTQQASSRPTTAKRPWSPPAGSTDAKVQAAFSSTTSYSTTPHTDPNPDVSSAWARVKQPKPRKPYGGDPDLSGVWANGFRL